MKTSFLQGDADARTQGGTLEVLTLRDINCEASASVESILPIKPERLVVSRTCGLF